MLDWIESTGTQYIDTGIKPNANIEFSVYCSFDSLSVGRFGQIAGSRYYFGVVSNYFAGANSSTYNHSIISADTNNHIFTLNNNGLYIDEELKYSNTGYYGTNLATLYLFAVNDNGNANYKAQCKVRSSVIKENGATIQNLVPVRRLTDNEVGMYDTVSKEFKPNAGTGSFIGSDE